MNYCILWTAKYVVFHVAACVIECQRHRHLATYSRSIYNMHHCHISKMIIIISSNIGSHWLLHKNAASIVRNTIEIIYVYTHFYTYIHISVLCYALADENCVVAKCETIQNVRTFCLFYLIYTHHEYDIQFVWYFMSFG